jgi:hypothetical protein
MRLINLQRFGLRRLRKVDICRLYSCIAKLQSDRPAIAPFDHIAGSCLAKALVERRRDKGRTATRESIFVVHMPKRERPNFFGDLLRMGADMILVLETQQRSAEAARSLLASRRPFGTPRLAALWLYSLIRQRIQKINGSIRSFCMLNYIATSEEFACVIRGMLRKVTRWKSDLSHQTFVLIRYFSGHLVFEYRQI